MASLEQVRLTSRWNPIHGAILKSCCRDHLQKPSQCDPVGLGVDLDQHFPPLPVGIPKAIQKVQEKTMREIQEGRQTTLARVLEHRNPLFQFLHEDCISKYKGPRREAKQLSLQKLISINNPNFVLNQESMCPSTEICYYLDGSFLVLTLLVIGGFYFKLVW